MSVYCHDNIIAEDLSVHFLIMYANFFASLLQSSSFFTFVAKNLTINPYPILIINTNSTFILEEMNEHSEYHMFYECQSKRRLIVENFIILLR